MSQIINAIPPNALLPVAGAMVGWVGHMLWFRSERAHVAAGMARIRQFMSGNDEWLSGHKQRFASAPTDPDVTGELVAVEETGLTFVVGENGPVLALSDRPAVDEDEVGDEQPGEAWFDQLFGWARSLWSRRPDFLKSADQQSAEFWAEMPQSSNIPPLTDGVLRAFAEYDPLGQTPDPDAEVMVELEAWVAANPPTNGPYIGRHWNPGTQHTDIFPAINANVPAPRDGGDN